MCVNRIVLASLSACVGFVAGAVTGVIVMAWALMPMRRPGR